MISLATQYEFTGAYTIKVDPRGRITLPREVLRDLEERVVATVLGDSELKMDECGVRYQNNWIYMVTKQNMRKRILEIEKAVKQEEPEAPEVFYKKALLDAKILISPEEEAKKVLLRHWRYEEGGKQRVYTTIELYLDVLRAHMRNREELDRKYIPERVMENIHMSAQRYEIDTQGRIYFGKEHEIAKRAASEERKVVLLGMENIFVMMTPKQRDELQKEEPKFSGRALIHIVR